MKPTNNNNIDKENEQDFPKVSDSEDLMADIDSIDKEIIRLKIENPKIGESELGKRFGISRQAIGRRLRKEKVKKALDQLQKNALDTLLDAQSEAARRMIAHMRSQDPDLSLKACKEILVGVLAKTMIIKSDRGPIRKFLDSLSDEDLDGIEKD